MTVAYGIRRRRSCGTRRSLASPGSIASKTDLGTVPQFLGRPQPYAGFLQSEIAFNKPKPLVVVMQDGYGTAAMKP